MTKEAKIEIVKEVYKELLQQNIVPEKENDEVFNEKFHELYNEKLAEKQNEQTTNS